MGYKINYRLSMATLWKHPNGTYYARWQEDGRNRRKSLGTKDKRIANREFRAYNRRLVAGKVKKLGRDFKINLNDFISDFLAHVEAKLSSESLRLYSDGLKKARSAWGNIPLHHITEKHIDSLVTDMLRAGLSVPTVNKNYRHVKAALKQAVRWKYMEPITFPKPIKEKESVRYIPRNHFRGIVKKIAADDPEFLDFCMLSGCSGLRSGELLRLQWSDIDNPQDFIRVTSEQKNKTESRIPINVTAREILNRCEKREGKKVFRFKTLTWISQKFKKYVRAAGFERYRFHDMRHTFASYLAMEGEDIKAIKDLMRHKSLASTEVYAKLSPEYLQKVSNRFNFGPLPIKTK